MKKLMQRSSYALMALVTVFAVGLIEVGAQNGPAGNGFRISPVRSEYTIDKGKSETLTITLENPSDGTVTAKPLVNDFIASDDESGEPRLLLDDSAPPPKNSFKKLVTDLADVSLAPREKKDIEVSITVPEDANAGGYYGAVRFEPQLGNSAEQSNVGLTASVGTIVLVRVPGNLSERLDLVQISGASKRSENDKDVYNVRSFFTGGDVAVLTRLKNSGDIHVQPFGKVLIKNMFGKVVHEFEFNNSEPRANILPDSTRKFGNDLPKMRWFGRYTIEANLAYSAGGGELLTARASFWYIPTIALFAIIALVLGIVGLIYWVIRKQKARKQHKHDVNKRKI